MMADTDCLSLFLIPFFVRVLVMPLYFTSLYARIWPISRLMRRNSTTNPSVCPTYLMRWVAAWALYVTFGLAWLAVDAAPWSSVCRSIA
ncbi:MAG: hypothetical protein EBW49_02910 [Betaproteobacteria bacterium]|nr:hypothetical protein [Betaproteobacteria bacterium]